MINSRTLPEPSLNLATIEQRVAAATPGPWTSRLACYVEAGSGGQVVAVTCVRGVDGHPSLPGLANAEFIAHARTDIPRLLEEVRRLRAELEQRTELAPHAVV
jgi:hypothetical protein